MNFWDTCFAIKIVIWISSQIHIGFPLWLWAQDFPSYQFHKLRFALDCWRLYKYVKTLDGPETLCFFAPKSTKRGLSDQKWFRNSNDWNPTIGHFNTHVVGGVFCFLTPFPSFSTPFSTYSFEIFWDIDWPVSWRFWLMNWKMNHPKQDSCCLNQLKKNIFICCILFSCQLPFFSWMWSSIVFLLFGETPCSYGHLSVISTYNPTYRMYNPIYSQL